MATTKRALNGRSSRTRILEAAAEALIAGGGDIDYVGATNVELIGPGEAAGTYREYVITGGAYETVQFR